jgi:hypothetical protein
MNDEIGTHKSFAVKCFNQTWDWIEKEDRTQEETNCMINAAHASRYHWEYAGDAVNLARGEWLISRVYAILKRIEPCRYHADQCYKITIEHDLKDFDLAFAYEAKARACSMAGDQVMAAKYITLGKEAGAKISAPEDRKYFFSQLNSI